MPNHITNCLEISHKDPKKIKWLKSCWDKKKNNLDFNKIIPHPDTPAYRDEPNQEEAKKDPTWWYDWNINNWGTKWGSYDGTLHESDDKFVCEFLTAWAPPTPIFEKLEEMGFEVNGLWKDEGDYEVHVIGEDTGIWFTNVSFEYNG